MNGDVPSVIYRWVLGGVCSGFVVYGYLLMGAVHDVRDEVSRMGARMELLVPLSQEIRDVDRLDREISQKADSEEIRHLVESLKLRIDEVNANLGFKKLK